MFDGARIDECVGSCGPPRVAVINTNYSGGGAAAVARTVHQHTNRQGEFRSTFVYSYGQAGPPSGVQVGHSWLKPLAALGFRLGGGENWLLARRTNEFLSQIERSDLVQLHNLHGYFLNPTSLLRHLNRPFVWTLHDSWVATGRCSLAANCDQWRTNGCRPCTDKRQNPGVWFNDRAARGGPP